MSGVSRTHPKNQIFFRFGIRLLGSEISDLEDRIREGGDDVILIRRWRTLSGWQSVFLMEVEGQPVYAVYKEKRGVISTFWDDCRYHEVMAHVEGDEEIPKPRWRNVPKQMEMSRL